MSLDRAFRRARPPQGVPETTRVTVRRMIDTVRELKVLTDLSEAAVDESDPATKARLAGELSVALSYVEKSARTTLEDWVSVRPELLPAVPEELATTEDT